MRIYLDTCCLSRLTDDLQQDRVRREAEAITSILEWVARGALDLVSSRVLAGEVARNIDADRRADVTSRLRLATVTVPVGEAERLRALQLSQLGFKLLDALHLACAEAGASDVFLSTDDKLLRCSLRNAQRLQLRALNPVSFLSEVQNGLPLQDG